MGPTYKIKQNTKQTQPYQTKTNHTIPKPTRPDPTQRNATQPRPNDNKAPTNHVSPSLDQEKHSPQPQTVAPSLPPLCRPQQYTKNTSLSLSLFLLLPRPNPHSSTAFSRALHMEALLIVTAHAPCINSTYCTYTVTRRVVPGKTIKTIKTIKSSNPQIIKSSNLSTEECWGLTTRRVTASPRHYPSPVILSTVAQPARAPPDQPNKKKHTQTDTAWYGMMW